jgi:hypothetical protein
MEMRNNILRAMYRAIVWGVANPKLVLLGWVGSWGLLLLHMHQAQGMARVM